MRPSRCQQRYAIYALSSNHSAIRPDLHFNCPYAVDCTWTQKEVRAQHPSADVCLVTAATASLSIFMVEPLYRFPERDPESIDVTDRELTHPIERIVYVFDKLSLIVNLSPNCHQIVSSDVQIHISPCF